MQTTLRKLTPPESNGTNISGTFPIEYEKEEPTSPGNPALMLAHKFFVVFDCLTLENQQLLIALVESFPAVSDPEKKVIVAAVERMAGL